MNKLSDNNEVFQLIAPNYKKEDEHWGANLDEIIDLISKIEKDQIVWVDAGCGPGHHIQRVINQGIPNKTLQITGVDYSPKMLSEAESRLGEYSNVDIEQGDITDSDVLPSADLITCLNNTFGNLIKNGDASIARDKFLRNTKLSLNGGGYLLLSVYNLKEMGDNYGQNLNLLHEDYENGDFIIEYETASGSTKFYSHWFTDEEIRNLLDSHDFEVKGVEKDNIRLIATAK